MPDPKVSASIAVNLSTDGRHTTITIQLPLHSADPQLWKTVAAYALNAIATSRRPLTRPGSRRRNGWKKNAPGSASRSISGLSVHSQTKGANDENN